MLTKCILAVKRTLSGEAIWVSNRSGSGCQAVKVYARQQGAHVMPWCTSQWSAVGYCRCKRCVVWLSGVETLAAETWVGCCWDRYRWVRWAHQTFHAGSLVVDCLVETVSSAGLSRKIDCFPGNWCCCFAEPNSISRWCHEMPSCKWTPTDYHPDSVPASQHRIACYIIHIHLGNHSYHL